MDSQAIYDDVNVRRYRYEEQETHTWLDTPTMF